MGALFIPAFLPGNEAGLTLEEFNHASEEHKAMKRSIGEPRLRAAGARYVIDTITDLPAVIKQIETRLTLGESPEGLSCLWKRCMENQGQAFYCA